jgi:ABC-type Fe3+/spermidine/putrescine transport system ATPase subunit
MTAPLLSLRSVIKRYGATKAVDGVSLDVTAGEFVSLLGPSGCGKTTLLRLIAGFVEPDGGAIEIGGRPMRGVPPARRNLGLVFQNYSLWPHMTVADNVAFGLDCRGVRGRERSARVHEALELVRLEALAGRFPRELSGGQQQRVALARALAYRPTLLLLDEPLSALDRKLREDLQGELRRLQRDLGVTTILVTHDQDEALTLSNRIAVMNAGRIEHLGRPEEVYGRPATPFVAGFVGRATLLPGVLRHRPHGTEFTPNDGLTLTLPTSDRSEGPARLLVRPEMVAVMADPTEGNRVTVEETVFVGSGRDVTLRTAGGAQILATLYDPLALPELALGQTLSVSLRGPAVYFDA